MVAKLIVRLLTAEGELLGWAAVRAKAKGDRKLWADELCMIPITRAGTCAVVSVHWADLHVQQRQAFEKTMRAGEIEVFSWSDGMMVFASDEGPLPGVTVGAETIALPPTIIGMVTH